MKKNNHAARIDTHMLPPTTDAVQEYESHGGHLTVFKAFGHDPLDERADLIGQRETQFQEQYPDFGPFFHAIVNGDNSVFRTGLLRLIEISTQLLPQL